MALAAGAACSSKESRNYRGIEKNVKDDTDTGISRTPNAGHKPGSGTVTCEGEAE